MQKVKRTRNYKRKFSYDPNRYKKRKVSVAKKRTESFTPIVFSILFKMLKPVVITTAFIAVIFYSYKFVTAKLYASDRFFIENINVEGCNNVTRTEIEELIPFKIGDSFFEIDLSKAEQDLQKCKPELKKITMSRHWKTNSIEINLQERCPEVFVVGTNKELLGLDFDNSPFRLRGNMSAMEIPVLKYATENERTELLTFIKECKPYISDFITKIKEIKFGDYEDIVFITNDGTEIFLGVYRKNNIKDKINKMKSVVADLNKGKIVAEYIDMTMIDSNKDRILVKPVAQENKIAKSK